MSKFVCCCFFLVILCNLLKNLFVAEQAIPKACGGIVLELLQTKKKKKHWWQEVEVYGSRQIPFKKLDL